MSDATPILIKLKGVTSANIVALIDPSGGSFTDDLADIYTALRPKIPKGYFYEVEEYKIMKDSVIVFWDNPRDILPGSTKVTAEEWMGVLELLRVRKGVDVIQVDIEDVNKVDEGEE
ncbi:hypothetical protein BJY04DRAFT_199118 [Aspergillus karnatakaensis]|uniref:uncharacterized protein n=1 Tax=Aspergillus karnatakaensis TaxID=1810916 RepID=UPI003CCC98CD